MGEMEEMESKGEYYGGICCNSFCRDSPLLFSFSFHRETDVEEEEEEEVKEVRSLFSFIFHASILTFVVLFFCWSSHCYCLCLWWVYS